jgi:F-type H+-transporting ATPase subunit a
MDDLHISLAAETLFHVGPIPVTNSMVTMFLVMGIILAVFGYLGRRASNIPSRGQGFVELIIEFLLGLVEGTGGRRLGRRIFPLISGIFIFILFSNLSGLLPGMGTIGITHEEEESEEHGVAAVDLSHDAESTPESEAAAAATGHEEDPGDTAIADVPLSETDGAAAEEEEHSTLTPIFRAPTADLNMTLALALLTFTAVQVAGISAHGVVGRLKHMADPPFLFPIELISEFSRILSLSARLFGNVFAGEVLLGVMYAMASAIKIALVPVLVPVIFVGLEVLFGTIQALVFALLTLIYISLAAASSHDDHHADEHPVDAPTPDPTRSIGTAPVPSGD